MVDFRSKAEKARDMARDEAKKSRHKQEQLKQEKRLESEARETLKALAPEIRDYRKEVDFLTKTVLELRKENEALHETLTEALRTQMIGVEDVKGVLIEKMESLTNDLSGLHQKIRAVAESDMQLVKQLNDNQQQRLSKLSDMVQS